jgi:hypothetical protein
MEEENRKTFVHFDFFEDLTADIPAEPCRGMEDIGERICQLREEKGEMGTSRGNGDVYVFKPLSPIKSNRFSFSIVSPRFNSRLAAG